VQILDKNLQDDDHTYVMLAKKTGTVLLDEDISIDGLLGIVNVPIGGL
jgi:hypothetical protein